MENGTKLAIGLAVLAAVAGVAIYYAEKPAPASGPVYSGGGVIPYTVSAGTMTPVGLSLTGDNQLQLTLPSGGTGLSIASSTPTVMASASNVGNTATLKALKVGSTTLSMTWADSTGSSQNSTVVVTVGV